MHGRVWRYMSTYIYDFMNAHCPRHSIHTHTHTHTHTPSLLTRLALGPRMSAMPLAMDGFSATRSARGRFAILGVLLASVLAFWLSFIFVYVLSSFDGRFYNFGTSHFPPLAVLCFPQTALIKNKSPLSHKPVISKSTRLKSNFGVNQGGISWLGRIVLFFFFSALPFAHSHSSSWARVDLVCISITSLRPSSRNFVG